MAATYEQSGSKFRMGALGLKDPAGVKGPRGVCVGIVQEDRREGIRGESEWRMINW